MSPRARWPVELVQTLQALSALAHAHSAGWLGLRGAGSPPRGSARWLAGRQVTNQSNLRQVHHGLYLGKTSHPVSSKSFRCELQPGAGSSEGRVSSRHTAPRTGTTRGWPLTFPRVPPAPDMSGSSGTGLTDSSNNHGSQGRDVIPLSGLRKRMPRGIRESVPGHATGKGQHRGPDGVCNLLTGV